MPCYRKTLQRSLASDIVLGILTTNDRATQGPISNLSVSSNIEDGINGINGITRLIHDTGFVAGMLDVMKQLEHDLEQFDESVSIVVKNAD